MSFVLALYTFESSWSGLDTDSVYPRLLFMESPCFVIYFTLPFHPVKRSTPGKSFCNDQNSKHRLHEPVICIESYWRRHLKHFLKQKLYHSRLKRQSGWSKSKSTESFQHFSLCWHPYTRHAAAGSGFLYLGLKVPLKTRLHWVYTYL